MTPAETAFFEDMLTVVRKHGLLFTKDTMDFVKATVNRPTILISMLGFQNLALSKYCVESVLEHSEAGTYELRLTNNGSTDGTKEYFDEMAKQFPQIKVVHNAENEGFQKPNNEAFDYAKGHGFKWVVYLNNDATVPAGWLDKLLSPFTDPRVAVVGPLGSCSRVNAQMQGCDDTKTEYIEFSCAMLDVEKISQVRGPWQPLFSPWLSFIYFEDVQVCLDVQYAGYKIAKAPFRIQHRGSQTAGAHPEAKEKCAAANARNQQVMLNKYAHWNKVRRFDHPIIVRRTFAAGDVLLTTPIIRALKKKYALCPIYVETGRPEVFAGNLNVDDESSSPIDPIIAKDALLIDLDGSYEAHPTQHVLDSYADAAGLERSEVEWRLELFVPHTMHDKMNFIRYMGDKCAAIHVGPTSWPGKNWPIDRWNAVAQWLRSNGWKVMLFGDGPKDARMLVDKDMRGQNGIPELAGLLGACHLFVGLCSFPAHVAAAVNVPSVVLYGVTKPECFAVHTAPFVAVTADPAHPDTGIRNSPSAAGKTFLETTDACMRTITVEMVVAGIQKLLVGSAKSPSEVERGAGMINVQLPKSSARTGLKPVVTSNKREEFRAE